LNHIAAGFADNIPKKQKSGFHSAVQACSGTYSGSELNTAAEPNTVPVCFIWRIPRNAFPG
jgi:hypothetical protein